MDFAPMCQCTVRQITLRHGFVEVKPRRHWRRLIVASVVEALEYSYVVGPVVAPRSCRRASGSRCWRHCDVTV